MTTPADFYPLPDRFGRLSRRRGFAHGVSQRFQVVSDRFLAWPQRQPDDIPASWRGKPVGVGTAEVVAVRLDVGRQRSEDRRGIPVYVGERADGVPFARRTGAAAGTQRPTSLTTWRQAAVLTTTGPPSDPYQARPCRSLTTADGIGMPGSNAITQGTADDSCLCFLPHSPPDARRRPSARGARHLRGERGRHCTLDGCARLTADLQQSRGSGVATGMAVVYAGRWLLPVRRCTAAGPSASTIWCSRRSRSLSRSGRPSFPVSSSLSRKYRLTTCRPTACRRIRLILCRLPGSIRPRRRPATQHGRPGRPGSCCTVGRCSRAPTAMKS